MANSPNHLLTSLTNGDFDLLKLNGMRMSESDHRCMIPIGFRLALRPIGALYDLHHAPQVRDLGCSLYPPLPRRGRLRGGAAACGRGGGPNLLQAQPA